MILNCWCNCERCDCIYYGCCDADCGRFSVKLLYIYIYNYTKCKNNSIVILIIDIYLLFIGFHIFLFILGFCIVCHHQMPPPTPIQPSTHLDIEVQFLFYFYKEIDIEWCCGSLAISLRANAVVGSSTTTILRLCVVVRPFRTLDLIVSHINIVTHLY